MERKFTEIGVTLIKCNDCKPDTCPFRRERPNPYMIIPSWMCTNPEAPQVKNEDLTYFGFHFRTCLTK